MQGELLAPCEPVGWTPINGRPRVQPAPANNANHPLRFQASQGELHARADSPARRAMSACPVRAVPVAAFASRNRISQTFASAAVSSGHARSQRRRSARRTVAPAGSAFRLHGRRGRGGFLVRVERLHPAAISRRVARSLRCRVNRRTSAPLRSACPSWGRASRRRTRPGRTVPA